MKKFYKISLSFFILFFGFCISVFAQNLVPNPSFEDYILCPGIGESSSIFAVDWHTDINSANYFHTCSSNPDFSVPDNAAGFQYPAKGDAYCGFYAAIENNPNAIEFIGTTLLEPLIIGQKYYVSFRVSLADEDISINYFCGVDKLGMLFTNLLYADTTAPGIIIMLPPPMVNNFSHIYTTDIIIDTSNWVTISGTFIADSAYKYILIGHFFDYNNSNIICLDTTSTYDKVSYYYVDDVCVSDDSSTCNIQTDIRENTLKSKSKINNYPNPFRNSTTFTYSIGKPGLVELLIHSYFGQYITTLVNEQHDEGSYSINWNTTDIAPGVYFYTLKVDGLEWVKKAIRIK